jgi:two-component system response regulator
VAEDNLPDALIIKEIVDTEKLPFEVHLVRDGEEAIAFIARAEADPAAPCPHVLLLDLNLPKKDGHQVLQRLRASGTLKDIPVVIVTSSDAPEDRSKAAELGAEFFRKPPSYDEFLKLGIMLRRIVGSAPQRT